MPIHDWSRVDAGLFHHFHQAWTIEISNALNAGGLLEAGFAFLLTVAVFATLIDPRGPRLGGVVVGMAQTAAVLVGFHLTGGAANPALYAGPGLWQLTLPGAVRPLADHPVYWGGPIVGALLGGLFYTALVLPPEKK